jgi:hypothetical protein
VSIVGDVPGSSRSEPAGMMISRPLRVACGSGEPQRRQKDVEKLRASGRSKRTRSFSPDFQRRARGRTYAFVAKALPVAFRHREQWHLTNLRNGRSTSNSIDRQRHPPRTIISRSPQFQLALRNAQWRRSICWFRARLAARECERKEAAAPHARCAISWRDFNRRNPQRAQGPRRRPTRRR